MKFFRALKALLDSQYALMLEYRVEIALWAVSGLLPLIMLGIWVEVDSSNFVELSNEQITRYFLSAFVVRQFTAVWVMVSFEEDTLEGRIAPFLLQPIIPFWRYFTSHVAEQITRIPIVLLMLIVFFIFLPDTFWIPSLLHILLSLLSIILAFWVRFLIHWCFSMLCFWNERASSIERLLLIPYIFLSGLVAPLNVFPNSVKSIAMFTPYPYLLAFPAQLLSGEKVNIINGFAMLIIWGIIFLCISLFAWNKGLKHYSAMGA